MHRYTGKFFFFHFSTSFPLSLSLFLSSLLMLIACNIVHAFRIRNRVAVLIIITTTFDAVSYLQMPYFDI